MRSFFLKKELKPRPKNIKTAIERDNTNHTEQTVNNKNNVLLIPFESYCAELLQDASRVYGKMTLITNTKIEQKYSDAQLQLAALSFGDIDYLKSVVEQEIDFPNRLFSPNYNAGFDWLDSAVSHNDQDAINYFQNRFLEPHFYLAYQEYKQNSRPDCYLSDYEPENAEALNAQCPVM